MYDEIYRILRFALRTESTVADGTPMIISVPIPRDVTISFRALAEWKQSVGMALNGELKSEYDGKSIEVAFFATEEDVIMFKLRFGI